MARDDLDIPIPAHAGHAGAAQGSSWRVSRAHSVIEPGTKRLLMIAGGVGGTLLALVGAYSLSGRNHGGIPVIEADARPLRERPQNPGGLEIAGADDAILGGIAGKDGMAPPPEAPAPGALLAQERAAQREAAEAAAAAALPKSVLKAAPVPGPAPVAQSAPPVLPPVSSSSSSASSVAAAAPADAKPAVVARAVPPAKPAVAAPAAQPVASAVVPSGSGGMQVQLAALPTEEAALSEWQRLSKKMPDMLGAKRPAVSRTERDGKTYFRLRTGGFSDVAQATAFCQRVREKGTGCTIAAF